MDYADFVYKQSLKVLKQKLDDFLWYCLEELGYSGPREVEQVQEFVNEHNIELELLEDSSLERQELIYTLQCKELNYKRNITFCFTALLRGEQYGK